MKKLSVYLLAGMILVTAGSPFAGAQEGGAAKSAAYDFGDYNSNTLVSKAWAALAKNDLAAVVVYTNKCVELYGAEARKMQTGLTDYVSGSNDMIFKYWALNDVATIYYILGEAYTNAGKKAEAQEAYQKVVNDFGFGQCWDPKGWFWKPADAAQKKLAELSI